MTDKEQYEIKAIWELKELANQLESIKFPRNAIIKIEDSKLLKVVEKQFKQPGEMTSSHLVFEGYNFVITKDNKYGKING